MRLPASDPPERRRVVIENVKPEVDCGRFAAKRVVGDAVRVEADVFAEGHDELACLLLYKRVGDGDEWCEAPMTLQGNDHWTGEFVAASVGSYVYALAAWVDAYATWTRDLQRRLDAAQDVSPELPVGAALIRQAAEAAPAPESRRLMQRAEVLLRTDWAPVARADAALDPSVTELMRRYAPRSPLTLYDAGQRIVAERERARFSAWYELFPRSTAPIAGKHGSFKTCLAWLPYIAKMGFDVLYLPPIHPIGLTNRKGPNNVTEATTADVGSPWAIGGERGGHTAVHPDLGTLGDFRALVEAAKGRDMEVALDFALQCSPDHPWVKEHPQWFRHRPDGSIRYAENPPKRYEDIYPIDFETEDREALWQELAGVVLFWIEQGVRIFRVDNPHTKPFAFWKWLIETISAKHPDVIFLAEAFTRPRTMYQLAKLGFTQSYTYFTWRNAKWELQQYFEELTQTEVADYFRPNLWPNTPDILHEYLQTGGRPAFVIRVVLAATLSASYGIYGPSFELGVAAPREPGSEEYLDSEKYELKRWDVTAPDSLQEFIARLNRVRQQSPALQRNDTLRFLEIQNENMLAYTKTDPSGDNVIVVVVNLDPRYTQAGMLRLPIRDFGLMDGEPYQVHDLMDGAYYNWQGEWNYVQLNPYVLPAHVLQLRRPSRLPTGAGGR